MAALAQDEALSETLEPLKKEKSDQGTDAPKFIILNLIEGKLEAAPEEPTPRDVASTKKFYKNDILSGALREVAYEDNSKGFKRNSTIQEIKETFQLYNGKAGTGAMELVRKNTQNSTIYTAFNEVNRNSFL